ERGLDDLFGLTVNGHVALDERRLAPALLHEALRLGGGFLVPLVVDGDAHAVTRETDRGRAPYPAARAGDERRPSVVSHVLPKLAGTPSRRAARWAPDAPSASREALRCGARLLPS